MNRSRGPDSIFQGSVSHTFNNGLAKVFDLLDIVRSKGGGNGRSVVHPPFQFELPDHLIPIRLDSGLSDLIPSDIGLVQIMDKVDGQFDQKVALSLCMVGVIKPVLEIFFGSEPQHGMGPVLDPKGLFPLFHDNGPETNP